MYKYLFHAVLCLVLVSLVLGCGAHNPRKVSKTVKASIQKTFDTEPQYANLKPVLSDLKLEMIDPSHYKGIAKVEVKGKTWDCEINVEVEGTVITWEPVGSDFDFMN